MNRRGFIGTLTALAGVVLAKVKPPVAPKYVVGLDRAIPGNDQLVVSSVGDFRHFAYRYVYVRIPDALYKWQPVSIQRHLLGCSPIDKPKQ